MKNKTGAAAFLVILAGVFWGSMGIFVRALGKYGFSPVQIVCIRVTLAALLFCAILPAGRSGARPALRDLPLFLGLGLGSILFFTVCYFYSISVMSLSAAAILLYTSPVWIMLMSVAFFREKITAVKLISLALAFGGCALVSGFSGKGLTAAGILAGLGSGIGYGLYSILGTVALRRFSPYAVTAGAFLTAAAGSWVICRPGEMLSKFAAAPSLPQLFGLCVLTAIVTAVIPFLSYTLGLRNLEASRAGILATVEPMTAAVVGILVFSEPVTALSALGIALILSAVVLLNMKKG